MFSLVKSESLPLTKELAEKHRSTTPSPTERDLDKTRVAYLADKAAAGELLPFQWAVARLGDDVYRINGHHSSTMLSSLNGSFPERLTVHFDEFKVDTLNDLALLFRQFDARKSSRSSADVSGAYQGIHDDLDGAPKDFAKLAVEGIAWYQKNILGSRYKLGDDQYNLFEVQGHHPFILWVSSIHSVKTPEMKSAPISAAMYATFVVNEAEARVFWDVVSRGGDIANDTAPATVLDTWLKAIKAKEFSKKPIKPMEVYQGCIVAWNAYRDGRDLTTGIKYKVDKGVTDPTH